MRNKTIDTLEIGVAIDAQNIRVNLDNEEAREILKEKGRTTKINAREFLLQSIRIRERMVYLRERVEKIEADLGYHPLQLDDSGASKASITDKVGNKLAELADLESEYKAELIRLEKKNEEIRNAVELLENTEYRAVLTARYLTENKRYPCRLNTWVAVAYSLGMTSEEAVKQKHKRAIKIFEKILRSDTP